jgi:16S rRNA (adenine1518-N6/adenine1519-N6)-dimethyltransferase
VVLAFTPLASPRVDVSDEAFFRKIVKAAFAQRRKTLANALKSAGFEPDRVEEALVHNQLDARIRGESLSLEQFAALANWLA